VRNGFNAFSKCHPLILVHDAVRPFVRPVDITNVIAGAKKRGAVTLAVPVKDTIKIVNNGKILGTPNRKTLWHTLTPQGFRYRVLKEALDFAVNSGNLGTDECQLAEKLGRDVYVVEGDYFNIKITTGEDRVFAAAVARLGR
jgi:2-C-methyl-D-erythritol 4-phosphate cytidylyltransferase